MSEIKAEDTVMRARDLCLKVCQDYRSATLEAKNCAGLDCEECQLEAQAKVSFPLGKQVGIREVLDNSRRVPEIKDDYGNEPNFILLKVNKAQLKDWGELNAHP